MYQLVFYVPTSHLEQVKDDLFTAGAGKFNNYDRCSFETKGIGQFRPLDGANPFIGNKNSIEKVEEYKVEMVVADDALEKVINTLKSSHPYEEPAYSAWKIIT